LNRHCGGEAEMKRVRSADAAHPVQARRATHVNMHSVEIEIGGFCIPSCRDDMHIMA
jgi:hypothetical protein